MTAFTITKQIDAAPETVFEYATDLRRAPERINGIVKMEVLTEGPIRLGTRFRETRIMFKREATEEMEITAFDPPTGYALGCESHGCRYRTEFRLRPTDAGTEMQMEFDAHPLTLPAKVLGFLFKPMLKACIKETEKDLDDLAAAIEADMGALMRA